MSSFTTARDIRLPGVVIGEVYIDPKQLSSRMKNMIKTMLRSGILKGGWFSQSKQLAKKIAEGTDVLLVSVNSRGLHIPALGTYGNAAADEVCALLDADEALELMNDSQTYSADTLERVSERTREQHNMARALVRGAHTYPHAWASMFSPELTQQVAEVFVSARTPAQIEAAEKLCDMIDDGTPIPITLSM